MEEAFAKAVAAAIIAGIFYGVRQVWIKWKISRMSDAELAALIEEAIDEAIDEDGPSSGELVTVRSGVMAGKKGRVVRKDAETITIADSSGREKTISRADL
jgi:hypothetical protein